MRMKKSLLLLTLLIPLFVMAKTNGVPLIYGTPYCDKEKNNTLIFFSNGTGNWSTCYDIFGMEITSSDDFKWTRKGNELQLLVTNSSTSEKSESVLEVESSNKIIWETHSESVGDVVLINENK